MIKAIEFPDKEFSTKAELFAHLCANHDKIMSVKSASLKNTDSLKFLPIGKESNSIKGVDVPEGSVLAVINTTKYMDSHNDVHLDGIWKKTVKDQQGKIFYIADHKLELTSIIAFPKDVHMSIQEVAWKDLGADYSGNTEALIFKIDKNNIELEQAKKVIDKNIDIDHSVRMQYISYDLAMDSKDAEHKAFKKLWDKTIDSVANKKQAEEQGYFWAVKEARVFKEGSMVLAGSNDITPMLTSDKHIEPEDSTQIKEEGEPDDTTQNEQETFFKNL